MKPAMRSVWLAAAVGAAALVVVVSGYRQRGSAAAADGCAQAAPVVLASGESGTVVLHRETCGAPTPVYGRLSLERADVQPVDVLKFIEHRTLAEAQAAASARINWTDPATLHVGIPAAWDVRSRHESADEVTVIYESLGDAPVSGAK